MTEDEKDLEAAQKALEESKGQRLIPIEEVEERLSSPVICKDCKIPLCEVKKEEELCATCYAKQNFN
jgi:hypothetical protein